jgi:DNA polymerase III alpha subunit/intein/homing endonuclease
VGDYLNNYIVYHLHDDTSNCNGYADSCTSYKEYIKLAKKCDMKAIAFSNHGGIYDWIKKKQDCDKAKIKYIHGVELYMCTQLENDERGYHIGLYARNWDGVKELNQLMSISTSKGKRDDKTDRHMYYNPRISIEEIMNTSSNIIITTACLASILWSATLKSKEILKDESIELEKRKELSNYYINHRDKFLNWLSQNNDRCFLEIQYHNCEHQKIYNQMIYEWSKQYNIPLISGTDTHSSTKYKAECRKILQKSKDSFYGEEDEFDLTWKTYDELINAFEKQNSLPKEIYMEAIENTNKFSDMIEDFKLDKTFKYPNLYENEEEFFKNLLKEKYNEKVKKHIITKSNRWEYDAHLKTEFRVFKKLGMFSFMAFMSELCDWCWRNEIPIGFGRGSVAGSTIAYILDITDVDPVRWKTVFSRFCNEDRISLGDIDLDFAPEDRIKVYNYIIERFTPKKTAYIAQFGTLKDRGTIDVLSKGLDYKDLDIVAKIKDDFDRLFDEYSKIIQAEVNIEELDELESKAIDFDNHKIYASRIRNNSALLKADKLKDEFEKLKSDNKDLFYYFDGIKGTIHSKGNHPSGIIGSPITLADNLGLFYKDGDENQPVSQCAMKAVDSINFVKFDILGLKTVGIIKDAYRYANLKWQKSHEIDWQDKKVWNNMIKSNVGVFQFEGDYAFSLLKDFKPNFINDMSLVNAALRPSGKSYRDRLIAKTFNTNPSLQIDELLKDNYGYLIYQEDTIKFLTDICGFSGSLADTTRRCVDENTLVTMGNGNIKKIKDIQIGENVISVNKYGVSESKNVANVFKNGIKEVYKITTIHGKELIATDTHKVFTQDGYKCIKDLSLDDSIMSLKMINADKDSLRPNERLSCQEMFLIGMLIGDGTIYSVSRKGGNNSSPSFTNSDLLLIDKFKECIISRIRPRNNNSVICDFNICSQDGVTVDKIYNISVKTPSSNHSLIRLLDKYNLRHHAANKTIHNELMSYPIGEKLQNLLGGLFSTDGGCYNNYIDYSTTSELLAIQIQNLLLKFGIYSYIIKKWVPDYNYNSYRVWISQTDSLLKFKESILPYVVGEKCKKYINIINSVINNEKTFNYMLPNKCKQEIRDNMVIYNKSFNDVGLALGYEENNFNIHQTEFGISDIKAREILKEVYTPYTYSLLMSEYIPLRVKSIEYIGERNVYDIEVENNHNYIANGLVVHNCIGKKDIEGLKQQLPKILEGYCKVSSQPREVAEEEAKQFIKIIEDSSEYQFGYNHSTAYSMNGYACVRLRTHYPIEFVTAYLNRAENTEDTVNGVSLAKELNMEVKPIEFGKSLSEYTFDKKSNTIYKGIASIKWCNSQIAQELYNLDKEKDYNNFIDLLIDIKSKTSTNSRQLKILTGLNFFRRFGKNKMLLECIDIFENLAHRKQINHKQIQELNIDVELLTKFSNKITEKMFKELDMISYIKENINKIEDKPLSIKEQVEFEITYLEYAIYTNEKAGKNFYIITEYTTYKDKTKPYVTLRHVKTGENLKTKIKDGKIFTSNPFKLYDILKVNEFKVQKKTKCIGGVWQKTNEDEKILYDYEVY